MDWTSILTKIEAMVVVISTVVAVSAMNETRKILKQVKEEEYRDIINNGRVNITNSGNNSGVISGTTEIQ